FPVRTQHPMSTAVDFVASKKVPKFEWYLFQLALRPMLIVEHRRQLLSQLAQLFLGPIAAGFIDFKSKNLLRSKETEAGLVVYSPFLQQATLAMSSKRLH